MATVPMCDLKSQYQRYKQEFDSAMQAVVDQTAFVMSDVVKGFEANFARYAGAKHCVGVGNGTDAIVLALQALGVECGDEVITTPWTFIATVEPIFLLGAKPVFVDIDPITYCMDPSKVEAAISERTKIILPVHIYGQLADMATIKDLAKRHGLKVLEDAAQAHGAFTTSTNGDKLLAGSSADAATFSFYPGKNLGAFGDAGGVTTDDDSVADGVRSLRNHGRREKYRHDRIGWNSRLDGLQAAVLDVKLKYINEWNTKRRQFASRYTEELESFAQEKSIEFVCPKVTDTNSHVFHLYTVRAPKRDALVEHLRSDGVGCAVHYPIALHEQEALSGANQPVGSLPQAEKAAREVVSLPLCPELTEANQERVIASIKKFYA